MVVGLKSCVDSLAFGRSGGEVAWAGVSSGEGMLESFCSFQKSTSGLCDRLVQRAGSVEL